MLEVFSIIGLGLDDEQSVEEIQRDAMRSVIVSASDLGHSSVGRHHDDRCLLRLESSVEVGEALNVKHVDLVDEENTRHDFRSALLSPFSNFLIDLISNLRLNLSNVSSEEG